MLMSMLSRVCTVSTIGAIIVLSSGCSSIMSSATSRLSDNLATALLNQNDPETVRQGGPAYLLLVDALIEGDPDNADLLRTGARLYGSYASSFVDDPERARRLATKARDYGWAALCRDLPQTCDSWSAPFEDFERIISSLGRDHVEALFGSAAAWASWVQVHRDDWVAVADKARVETMMQRVVELDEPYLDGAAHVYLGVLDTLLPAALGGKPEQGREHFERALELSGERDLMAKMLLAREYARLVFDRQLHDRLCREIVEADPEVPGLTLANTMAQEGARELLATSEDYFGE
jgi:hypothetical protein